MRKTKKLVNGNCKKVKGAMKRFACVAAAGLCSMSMVFPAWAADAAIEPQKADYGYYVDEYQKNGQSGIKDTIDNPANGVLSEMLDYFTPGTDWNNGIVKNETMHKMNIAETAKIRDNASEKQQVTAFYDDVRDKNYSMISGLGTYADKFKNGVNAQSYIIKESDYAGKSETDYGDNTDVWSSTVPEDAKDNKYMDVHNDGQWAIANGDYAGIVNLVGTLRGGAASTSAAKKFYKYMRPYRWSRQDADLSKVTILSSLTKMENSNPSNDGGYPSGHTNAAYLAAIAMAYSVPEQYSELMLRASELGMDRIVAGMHSCLDVIGGRMTSTAIAASNLYDSNNNIAKLAAVESGNKLTAGSSTVEDKSDYDSYQKDKETYLYRMTYNLKLDDADTSKDMVVPKGAETLLESRYPYMSKDDIRYVLYTTGVSSGYSVLDDKEGWGRLNLFEAANGYGSFATDVTVNMDASKGGYNAADNWKNDIDGKGSLTKEGTGMLVLSGNNSYEGSTNVNAGTIRADYKTAFGKGNVVNNSTVIENTDDTLVVNGDYSQGKDGVLELTVSNENDIVDIKGNSSFGGKLILNFENYIPDSDIEVLKCASVLSNFDEVVINAPEGYTGKISYAADGINLTFDNKSADDNKEEVKDDIKDNNDNNNNVGNNGNNNDNGNNTIKNDNTNGNSDNNVTKGNGMNDAGIENSSESEIKETVPATGDNSMIGFSFVAFVLSLAGILSSVYVTRKKEIM